MIRTFLVVTVLIAVVALNPMFGCDQFTFNETDMKRVIEGHWKLTLEKRDLDMTIRESRTAKRHASRDGIFNSAEACGTRSFVNTADACVDDTEMTVDVAIGTAVNHGTFRVFGTSFERGTLEVEVDQIYVTAHFDSHGDVLDVLATDHGKQATAKLARL
jgi:hypothetical protein